MKRRPSYFFFVFVLPIFLVGCTSIAPESLKTPERMSCIEIPPGIEAHEKLGLLKIPWIYTLTPGPYLSEREDEQGIYYRAPPSGITINRGIDSDGDDSAAKKTRTVHADGGIWLPRDTTLPPHLYFYLGSRTDQAAAPLDNANCANAVLLPGAKTGDVNAVAFAVAGAAGGAAGGIAGRSIAGNGKMSYGQAAGTGAVGGAIAGLVIAKLIDMEHGHIQHGRPLTDPIFLTALQEAAKTTVLISTPKLKEKVEK
ncbi:hypothetical protein [Herbaspirillum rubrisubalbicans]|nr:hypothetical protein [Herbaspirillum rubrisubalbicans]